MTTSSSRKRRLLACDLAQTVPGQNMNNRALPKSPRRSLLFAPGDSLRKIESAARSDADAVILDLEDSVATSQKDEARRNVAAAISDVEFGRSERLVRLNQPDSAFYEADLRVIASSDVDGLVLAKVESAGHIRLLDQFVSAAERTSGKPAGAIRLFALIETALGIMNVGEIAQASYRLDGLLFGAEDLAADLGASRTSAGWEIFYGRGAVVTAAAAYGLDAIDTVFVDLHDLSGLEQDASFAQRLGFSGKMAIHPRQLEVLNRVFTPTAPEIAQAQKLLRAYQAHLAAGSGVFTMDDRMVDMPHVKAAERLLQKARLAGPIEE